MPRDIKRISTDGLLVSRNEAIFLTAHHLKLAAQYFEACPNNASGTEQIMETIIESTTTIKDQRGKVTYQEPCVDAARAFLDNIDARFVSMDETRKNK